jgi:hypothetical protein
MKEQRFPREKAFSVLDQRPGAFTAPPQGQAVLFRTIEEGGAQPGEKEVAQSCQQHFIGTARDVPDVDGSYPGEASR